MTEGNVIDCTPGTPATTASLVRDLAAIGVRSGSVLLVHSSLSALGWVVGGAVTVVRALQSAVGANGTLVMPTHSSGLSEPSLWQNPPVPESWWPIIRDQMPPFDPQITPTQKMGAIVDCFRSHSGVLRSNHPHVSFAAQGPHAEEITSDHELANGLGDRSPLGRIYSLNGHVLLLGVGHENNTSLHLSEARAYGDKIPTHTNGAPILIDGVRRWATFDEPEDDDSRFSEIGASFAASTGLVQAARVAQAEALLMPQMELVDFGIQWLQENA